jgi:glucose dehydrogenase
MSIKTYGRRPLLRTLFRWFVTTAAVLAFAQAALAGAFLSGHYGALNLHSINASLAALAALGMAVVGGLIWRPGRGAAWPALVSLGVFVAEVVQIGFGYARSLSLHVPLGVAIIVGLVVLTLRVWRPEEAAPVAVAPGDAAPTAARPMAEQS